MTLFTLNLSDRAVREVFLRASRQGQTVDEFVGDILEDALSLEENQESHVAAQLSDEDVLAMADYMLSPEEQSRLDDLLVVNREETLTADQQAELDRLMRLYHEGTLRKSIGWAEAVRRGLRSAPPL